MRRVLRDVRRDAESLSSPRSPASGRRGRRSGSCGRRGAICPNIARSAAAPRLSSISAIRPPSRSRRRCSRSAASASTRRSSSPTFSSIPDALGQTVAFETGEGPRLDPIADAAGLAKLRDEPDWAKLAPVFETLDRRQKRAARRRRADRLLRRALDGGELHDRRARHARPGAGAALRLSPADDSSPR